MITFKEGSIFSFLNTPSGAVTAAVMTVIVLCLIAIFLLFKISPLSILKKVADLLIKASGKIINKQETNYSRELAIGKINEKKSKVKIYRFLNELIIDLGLKQQGFTPYEYLFMVMVLTFVGIMIISQILFSNFFMGFILYPIALAGVICVAYTQANLAHDKRIEAIIEAENIICNSVSNGVLVAVKETITTIPEEVRTEFKDFIDNVESKNFHIKTALLELNNSLGSISDDFIKKCIMFELEEEHGIVGIFKDIVEINNIKSELRIDMKRKFEDVKNEFIISAMMIFVFLAGVLIIYEDVRNFYLRTVPGQIIIAIDILILIVEFVYITVLRAKEL